MAFEIVTTSFRQKAREHGILHICLVTGGLMAVLACYACLIGLVMMLNDRSIVSDFFTLGQALVAGLPLVCGYLIAVRARGYDTIKCLLGAGAGGAVIGLALAVLLLLTESIGMRWIFINASPALADFLRMGQSLWSAFGILTVGGLVLGVTGGVFARISPTIRTPIVFGIAVCLGAALLADLIKLLLSDTWLLGSVYDHLFDWQGLRPWGAIELLLAACGLRHFWPRLHILMTSVVPVEDRSARRRVRSIGIAICCAALLALPVLAGPFIGQVMMLVVLFILMGLGLNLEIGLAGLLDLGFVAFFAIGAYTMALLTSNSEFAIADLSFWAALPISALTAAAAGVVFGLPVLRVRGDYLAVATLGLGEIVRLLVISELLKPSIGGSQGILGIPKPFIGSFELSDPSHLVYIPLASCVFVAYCAWRLARSRIGRAWMALREDEDVAQALGLDLVGIKLFAYGLGAAFAGIAGGIFASMVGAVFPHSFQLIISINVLALIILGGMGSVPGVMVGALALVGIPELLREFGEFRFLFYGVVLVVMMRFREEGLWPSRTSRRVRAIIDEPQR